RITPRRSLSPAFIAAFMSLVSCCFRVMAAAGWGGGRKRRRSGRCGTPALRIRSPMAAAPRTQKAGHARACRLLAKRRGSVQALALGDVARHTARLALHRGGGLALALLGRLLVELALAGLGEDAGLLAGALEATQGKLERLVFAVFDAGHRNLWLLGRPADDGPVSAKDSHLPARTARGAAYDSRSSCNGATGRPSPPHEGPWHRIELRRDRRGRLRHRPRRRWPARPRRLQPDRPARRVWRGGPRAGQPRPRTQAAAAGPPDPGRGRPGRWRHRRRGLHRRSRPGRRPAGG